MLLHVFRLNRIVFAAVAIPPCIVVWTRPGCDVLAEFVLHITVTFLRYPAHCLRITHLLIWARQVLLKNGPRRRSPGVPV